MIQAPTPRRERILVFGLQGTGKSETILSIAQQVAPNKVTVVDTERAYEALVTSESNVEVKEVVLDDWEAMLSAVQDAVANDTAEDWLAVDSGSMSWEAIQGYALEQGWTETRDGEKGVDWIKVNAEHTKLYRAYLSYPGHLILTARQKDLGSRESKQTVNVYGPYFVKPAGQKDLGHIIPHTVLLLTTNRSAQYQFTTIKDRKRALVENAELGNFARDYLVKIAGWVKP
jgi:hypothetical protein